MENILKLTQTPSDIRFNFCFAYFIHSTDLNTYRIARGNQSLVYIFF